MECTHFKGEEFKNQNGINSISYANFQSNIVQRVRTISLFYKPIPITLTGIITSNQSYFRINYVNVQFKN